MPFSHELAQGRSKPLNSDYVHYRITTFPKSQCYDSDFLHDNCGAGRRH